MPKRKKARYSAEYHAVVLALAERIGITYLPQIASSDSHQSARRMKNPAPTLSKGPSFWMSRTRSSSGAS